MRFMDDFYDSLFGAAYSAYMLRPRLGRAVGRLVWGGDMRPFYASMKAISAVPPGGTVVDCPCGPGTAFRAIAPDSTIRYLAIDLSPSMLRRAARQSVGRGLANVELQQGDATNLPLEDGIADLFLSYWGLHCFDQPARALAEAGRVLKPQGRLVGSCFVRGEESRRQQLLVRPGGGGFGKTIGTQEEVEGWIAAAGLATASFQRSGPMAFFEATARAG